MSVLKHTDPVPDPRAVNQDKKNMLFSVSFKNFGVFWGEFMFVSYFLIHIKHMKHWKKIKNV